MQYRVNDTILSYEPTGEVARGKNEILLESAIDLTAGSWKKTGFTVQPLFDDLRYESFQSGIRSLLLKLWKEAGLNISDDFKLDQYHTVTRDRKQHLAAVEKTKLLSVNDLPIAIGEVENRISEICQTSLRAKNPFDGQSIFHFRVIRPDSSDNNPLHRDVWLEDYKDCINLYIPVAGSNPNSSLILLPGSHHWPESRIEKTVGGAMINGVRFNVPAVTAIHGPYSIARPDPKDNEVLVFSPYLIHGGAVNLNRDQTRISIEMRFWKK